MLSAKEIEDTRKLFSETDADMVKVFKVLSEINRFRIFRILLEQPKISISTLAHILTISIPLASQHIKILEQAHLIQKEKGGKKKYPKLNYDNPFVQVVATTIQEAYTFVNN